MPDRLVRARLFRQRAEALRTIAGGWRDPETLQKVNDLACDYDKMAEELERAAKSDGVVAK
jgi:hypothetical protein